MDRAFITSAWPISFQQTANQPESVHGMTGRNKKTGGVRVARAACFIDAFCIYLSRMTLPICFFHTSGSTSVR